MGQGYSSKPVTSMPLNCICACHRCHRSVKDDGTCFYFECPGCDYEKIFCSPVHRAEYEARHNRRCPEQQPNQAIAELGVPTTASPENSEAGLPQQNSDSEKCTSAGNDNDMSASELGTEMKRRLSLPDFSGDEEDGADEEGGDSSGESDNQEGGVFHTPPGTPGTHAPELADPAVRQRIVDYHERRIIDDLGLEDMETHQALQAIHERDRLRTWHGNSSDKGNIFADWHPSNATFSTQPVASYSHMNFETSAVQDNSMAQDQAEGQGEQQGSRRDDLLSVEAEEDADYEMQRGGDEAEDGAGGEHSGDSVQRQRN